jgi:hypothetical protein
VRDRALRFVRENVLELVLVALGVFLRIRIGARFQYTWGYDWGSHLKTMQYIVDHHALPPLSVVVTAYHPPLFYLVGAWVIGHGGGAPQVQALCVAAGIVRMIAIAYGLHRYVTDRFARVVALALAAVLPCSLHLDAMLTNEAFSAMFSVLALLCVPPLFADAPRRRTLPAVAFAVAITLALLCKVSALVVLAAVGVGAAAELCARSGAATVRARRALPIALAVATTLAVVAPVYARNHAETHKWLPASYDSSLMPARYSADSLKSVPYLDRRTLGYVFGLGWGDLLEKPYWPTLGETHPRFWPVVVASTFSDYWIYLFAGPPVGGEPALKGWAHELRESSLPWARRSVAAGFVIAAVTVVALVGCFRQAWRRRDFASLALLATPVLTLAGMLNFAITFPWDDTGLIKGHYLQFGTAPLFAVFGLGLSWCLHRGSTRPVALAGLVSLGLVAGYTWHSMRCWPFG